MVEAIERPIKLDPDSTYRLLTAKRSRGGITLRGELKGREILTRTQFEAHAGDFLISRRQIIHGACGLVPEALHGAVVSNEYSILRTRTGLLMDFLRHFSHAAYFQRTCFHSSHGVDVEKMVFKLDQWLDWPVDVPPLGEQRKITAILSSVDDAIEATQAVIDQLQVVKKAMMAELLARGLPGRHTRFKKTEIGEVPEEWEVNQIEQLVESCDYGLSKSLGTKPVGVAVLRMGNLNDGQVILDNLKFISEAEVPNDLLLDPGDVLFNRTNSKELVGKVGVFSGALMPVSFASYLLRLRTHRSRAIGAWLGAVMNLDSNQELLRGMATPGVSQVNINRGKMLGLHVPVPPVSEQKEIISVLEGMEARLRAEELTCQGLLQLKSSLLSALITGEVRVTPDEAAL
ncbi:hypothetical protein [Sorangium sp. So ce1182]|uniref:hypothetical protein n=1 Tax=Sorangium sp. So ce1182 TaxID=3133334 RepID=UPI003F5E8DAF